MMSVLLLLVQSAAPLVDPLAPAPPTKAFGLNLQDLILILGLVGVIALVVIVWAYLTRKDRHRQEHPGAKIIYESEAHESHHGHGRHKVRIRKKRSRHADNLPRNPTLAQAGGLPPIRPEQPAPPAT